MRTYILTILCLALVLGVLAGCAPQSSAPAPSAARTDEVCVYISTYVSAIDQTMAIIKAAPLGDSAGMQRSADRMRGLAIGFKRYVIPKEIERLGLSMAFVLAAYAQMMQDEATGSIADMKDSTRLATGLMSDTADAAHAVQIRHGCQ